MNIVQIFRLAPQSWGESLKLFAPNNFIPFFLITIKTWLKSYPTILFKWPLIYWVLFFMSFIYSTFVFNNLIVDLDYRLWLFSIIIISIIPMLYACTVRRQSIDNKDALYWYMFLRKALAWLGYIVLIYILFNPEAFPFSEGIMGGYIGAVGTLLYSQNNKLKTLKELLLFFIISGGLLTIHYSIKYIIQDKAFSSFFLVLEKIGAYFFMITNCLTIICFNNWAIALISCFFSPLLVFALLFMLDAENTLLEKLKAFLKALIMFIYNYPFCFIVYWASWLLLYGIDYISIYFGYYYVSTLITLLILLPFYYSLLTNFYFKRVHDQLSLYYNNPE